MVLFYTILLLLCGNTACLSGCYIIRPRRPATCSRDPGISLCSWISGLREQVAERRNWFLGDNRIGREYSTGCIMGLHNVSGRFFFSRSLSGFDSKETTSEPGADEASAQDSAEIEAHFTQTAKESSRYFNHVISLAGAKSKSFSDLKTLILDKETLATTCTLLESLEQSKSLFLPAQSRRFDVRRPERIFLSAYLIATKSEQVFESPADIDEHLLAHANEMLGAFESLCQFMSETPTEPTEEIPSEIDSPTAAKIPCSDPKLLKGQMETEWRAHLEAFQQTQMTYYETFLQWESNHRVKLTRVCIDQYLQLESERFASFTNPDPRMGALYDAFDHPQEVLRKKIKALSGMEGLQILEHDVQEKRAALEANKWATAPKEVLLHELALNPGFELPVESCIIRPHQDIDAAIAAVSQKPVNLEPMLDVFEEIRDGLASLTPHNKQYITRLQKEFSRQIIRDQIDAMGLERGLYQVVNWLIEKIKELESAGHDSETVAFEKELRKKCHSEENLALLLKQTIDLFYHKISQITLESRNFHINQACTPIAHGIVEFEQEKFQEHLAGKQFNLASILDFVDSMIETPTKYRLTPPILYSHHIATYLAHAVCIAVLQRPGKFDFQAVPETFYLDRVHLVDCHGQYQRIFYTAAAMGIFCQQYGDTFLPEELLEHKKMLITALGTKNIMAPEEAAGIMISTLSTLLTKKGKPLSESDESALTKIVQAICAGTHPLTEIINRRLGDQLWSFLFKGFLPEIPATQAKLYGLQEELRHLGQEIIPLLRLHVKVYGEFYKHSIDLRLWRPLFVALREVQKPHALSSLLAPAQELIGDTADYIHRMAFLLTGLSLIQQNIAFADNMYNLQTVMKHSTMKALADSFGLIDGVKNPNVSIDKIGARLIELMQHVASEQEVPFEAADKQKMAKMFHLAKNGKSPGYNAFLDELVEICKQFITKEAIPELNKNLLTAEFTAEIKQLCGQVQEITAYVKQAHSLGLDELDPVTQPIPMLHAGIRTLTF